MRPGNKKIEAEEEVGQQPGEDGDAESCEGPGLTLTLSSPSPSNNSPLSFIIDRFATVGRPCRGENI